MKNEPLLDEIKRYSDGFSLTNEKINLGGSMLSDLSFAHGTTSPLDLPSTLRISNIVTFLIAFALVLFVFIGRAYGLAVLNKDYYLAISNENLLREIPILPERGVLFDRSGDPLVRNKPTFSLVLDARICTTSCNSTVESLKGLLAGKIDSERVFKLIDQKHTSIILSNSLSRDDILGIEGNLKNFPGVSIATASQRDYLYKDVFSHALGYVGLDTTLVGKTGVEEYYDKVISGVLGNKIVQVDSLGIEETVLSQKDAFPGKDLTLNLDLGLQNKAYELLKKEIDAKKATAGVVVAQDPATGGVLALVNYPGFDPQKLSDGISATDYAVLSTNPAFPFFNRAIAGVYPPGSVFKMVSASAILMEHIVTPSYQIFDPGFIQVGGSTFRNWKLDGHGDVDLKRALQVSNDTYFYKTVGGYGGLKGLGIKKLYLWATKFGFGQKTDVDLDSETTGFMPNGEYKTWYLGDTYITAIGQGDVLATPLQVNNMVSYFANGGKIFEPHLVQKINGVADITSKILIEDIVDNRSYEAIREGMRFALAPGGTAYPFFDFPQRHNGMRVAGKTGTSEYTDTDGKEKTHAWFSVFGPYDTPAKIVLTVFLEGGGAGSSDAAPIARELMDYFVISLPL